jgi:hypothetical protein
VEDKVWVSEVSGWVSEVSGMAAKDLIRVIALQNTKDPVQWQFAMRERTKGGLRQHYLMQSRQTNQRS